MSDITMCSSENCVMKEDCKRHTATVNKQWQSWCDFSVNCNESNDYDFKEDNSNVKAMWERR